MWVASYLPKETIIKMKTHNVAIEVSDTEVNYSLGENTSWLTINDLDSIIWDAFVMNEDNNFWKHSGLNYMQIRGALSSYLFEGKSLRGASTITQQVAKNIFLHSSRSWKRKLKEAIIAKEMERHLSKHRILEIYLNIVEFGEGIYGLQNASEYYFDKNATELSASEGIYLASILPNPRVFNDAIRTGILTSRDSIGLIHTLDIMLKKKKIDSTYYELLLIEPLVFRKDSIGVVE
jgi:membrane peptidoglycan carboxypeptidase